jgi:hypothetical protein
MTSRSEMDRPAIVATALLGIVLIAVSAPFLGSVGSDEGTTYNLTWTAVAFDSASAPNGGAGQEVVVAVTVDNALPATALVSFDPCDDAAQPPLQSPATIAWSLERDGVAVQGGSGSASCDDFGPFEVALGGHPDVAQVKAASADEAEGKAYGATPGPITYTLRYQWTRPAGVTGPLPLPQPAFSTTGVLDIQVWAVTANTMTSEATR